MQAKIIAISKEYTRTPAHDKKDIRALFAIVALVLKIAAMVGKNLFGLFKKLEFWKFIWCRPNL